jgi:hypothetical protein
VIIGDWWDLPSLSLHDAPGSKEAEGRRVKPDIDAGNEAFERFYAPIKKERDRLVRNKDKQWNPRCEFLMGNHENRLTRAIFREPKWEGILTMDALKTPGFNRNEFLKIVEIDGIRYCHYFQNPFSGRPIGGTIPNRLNHIGGSFVQGHQQGFLYGSKQYPDHVAHGLVAGRFYSRRSSRATLSCSRTRTLRYPAITPTTTRQHSSIQSLCSSDPPIWTYTLRESLSVLGQRFAVFSAELAPSQRGILRLEQPFIWRLPAIETFERSNCAPVSSHSSSLRQLEGV